MQSLHIGPGKMIDRVKGGNGIAHAMQLPCNSQLMKVNWVKHNGFMYRPHLIICGKVESEMPLFFETELVQIIVCACFSPRAAFCSRSCSVFYF